jgi:hypothetical protein
VTDSAAVEMGSVLKVRNRRQSVINYYSMGSKTRPLGAVRHCTQHEKANCVRQLYRLEFASKQKLKVLFEQNSQKIASHLLSGTDRDNLDDKQRMVLHLIYLTTRSILLSIGMTKTLMTYMREPKWQKEEPKGNWL